MIGWRNYRLETPAWLRVNNMATIDKLSKDLAGADRRRDELKDELAKLQVEIAEKQGALGEAVYTGVNSNQAADEMWKLEKRKQALGLAIAKADQVVSERQLHLDHEREAQAVKQLQALDKTGVTHLVDFFKGVYMMLAASDATIEDIDKIGEFARGNDISPKQTETWKMYEFLADADTGLARVKVMLKAFESTRPELAAQAKKASQ